MASGGFGYASVSVTYHAADYGTNYAWALALHKARALAFLRATYKAYILSGGVAPSSGTWGSYNFTAGGSSRQMITYTVEYAPDDEPGDEMNIYIQDVNGSSETGYPAFVTIFQNPDLNTAYAIITARGFHNNSSWIGTASRGFYIPVDKCMGNGYLRYIPYSFAHAFAASGFNALPDIDSGTLAAGELPICQSYGCAHSDQAGTASTSASSNIITNPTENYIYTFGYAVKDLVIEAFYKNSGFAAGSGADWDISGQILTGDPGYDLDTGDVNGSCFGYFSPYIGSTFYEHTNRSVSSTLHFFDDKLSADVLDSSGDSYSQAVRATASSNQYIAPTCTPGYLPLRGNSTLASKLVWSSACLAFGCNAGSSGTRNLGGVDANGNSVAGFLRDDVFRFVSIFATRNGGTTYQNGNFIAMNCGQNTLENGVLLGWDASNNNDIL